MLRRDFLEKFIKTVFSGLVFVLFSSLAYLYPSRINKRVPRYIYLMDEFDLPRKGVRKVDMPPAPEGATRSAGRVYLAALEEGAVAFSPVCTHLGCLVSWNNNVKQFLCPCHGGKYDISGKVISGPPPRPLARLPLEIREGKVYVGI
jgi:cytochrome b6-f complex iron-sulfur subunit